VSRKTLLAGLAVLSGAFGINYEVLYYRLITSRFGDMLHVHAAILATFLLAIAMGSVASSRLRRWLWLMETLVGVTALVIDAVLAAVERSSVLASIGGSGLLTVGFCAVLVFLPAMLVGMSVPLFSGYLAEIAAGDHGHSFRVAYALYNLGAAASVLLVEYLLVRSLGHHASLYSLAFGNILIGLVLFLAFPGMRAERAQDATVADKSVSATPQRVLWGVFFLGMSSSIFQMVFARVALEIIGPSREVFALSLALVLVGFPLGALLKRFGLTRTVLLAVIATGVSLASFSALRQTYYEMADAMRGKLDGMPSHAALRLGILAVIGLIPFACYGAILPLVLPEGKTRPEDPARAMFFSGLGNSAGYLVFILGVHRLLPEAAQVLTVFAVAVFGLWLAREADAGAWRPGWALGAVAVVPLFLSGFTPEALYRHHFITPTYRLDDTLSGPGSLSFRVERRGSDNAGVVRRRDDSGRLHKSLFYLGHTSIVASVAGQPDRAETLMGAYAASFTPTNQRALVLGVGTGITAGNVAQILQHTDAIEINDAVIALVPEFDAENLGLAHNPKATIVHDDARTFLLGVTNPYDAIVSSVAVPTFEAASKIYTTEFFRRAKGALKPDGVFSTFIGLGLNDVGVRAIAGSLKQVFGHCFGAHLNTGYFALTCSDAKLRPRDPAELLPESVRQSLARVPIGGMDLGTYLRGLFLHDDFLATVDDAGLENTDDMPIVEFFAWNPRIRVSLMPGWPQRHPEFATFDFVTGQTLSDSALLQRCVNFEDVALYETCTAHLAQGFDGLRGAADALRGAIDARRSRIPDIDEAMTALLYRRAAALVSMHNLRRHDSALSQEMGDALAAVAKARPDLGEVQAAAGEMIARIPGREDEARDFAYRAIATDARFRTFASVERKAP
jgi:spermidine synthase